MDMMAIAVNKVLQELEINTCVMIGHSMGGYVTLSFARKYPGKIKGFGLFHSHAAEDTPEQKVDRNRTIKLVESDRKNFIANFFPGLFAAKNVEALYSRIEKMREEALEMHGEAIIAALEGMKLRVDSHDVLKNARVPVLFIIGREDPRIPAEKVLHQAIIPTMSEVLVLEEVGHMGFLESRKQCLKTIRHFAHKCFK
jgi:pimeloyl-ACP methyl ester carboxylesterase